MTLKQDRSSLSDFLGGPPAASHVPLYHASGGWKSVPGPVFDIRAEGADPTGVADSSAGVWAALRAAEVGGGAVYVPPGNFRCDTPVSGAVLPCVLDIRGDNVWLRGAGPASRLYSTTAATRFLLIAGNHKPAGPAGWTTYRYQTQTVYPMAAATAGDVTITLTHAGDGANFVAGDYAYVRTGQLVGASTTEPDAEIVKIRSVAGDVLTLAAPLLKDYVQEYFVSGTTGVTTRAVTANLAAFGVSKITAMTIANVRVSDLTIDQTNQSNLSAIAGGQCYGLTVDDSVLTGTDVTIAFGDVRHLKVRDNRMELTREAITSPSAGGSAKGSADILYDGNTAISHKYPVNWQFNEGSANVSFVNNTTISGPGSGASGNPYTGNSRPRNHIVEHNRFIHGGTGAVISISIGADRAATGCGGLVKHNHLVGAFGSGIGVDAPGYVVDDNVIAPSSAISVYESLQWWTGAGTPVGEKVLWGWVTSATQTITLGTLPVASWPIAVFLHVRTAFDSDGTDQIQIGTDGVPNQFGALTDVSTTGVKTVTLATTGYRSSALITKAFYVNGGSEPAHGQALVGIVYAMAPQAPSEGA